MQSLVFAEFLALQRSVESPTLCLYLLRSVGSEDSALQHVGEWTLTRRQALAIRGKAQRVLLCDGSQHKAVNSYVQAHDGDSEDGADVNVAWLRYMDSFVQAFERELRENVSRDEDDFCGALRARLCAKYYGQYLPVKI